MAHDLVVYRNLVELTENCVGDAGKRLVDLHVEGHLHKNPESLTAEDLSFLHHWIVAVVCLMSKDQSMITEYSDRIEDLALAPTEIG